MKKKILSVLITILAVCTLMFTMTACGGKVEFKINFVVDGEVYAVVNTNGEEIIKMPANPTKEGYTFDGWYWDKDTWQTPFTANSLLDAPLSSNMSVYAKFSLIHVCSFTEQIASSECIATVAGCENKATYYYSCACGEKGTETFESGEALGHSFTNYVYNNDADCEIDGTETATCNNGCGERDTRTKEGTALEHDYSAWVTNNNGTHTRTCSHNNSHKETKNCNGGAATCRAKAVCIDCGAEYGDLAGHIAKEEWSTTEKYHYHACKTENCTEKLDKENHAFDKNKKCTVCDYVTTELLWTEISSDVFAIDGTNLYVKVPNKQTYFAFAETINVAEGATYKVYSDIQCKEESNIPSYMVNNLVAGDNTYYFLVSNEGSFPKIYTVTVRRKPMYTVSFNSNGGTNVQSQTIEEDGVAIAPVTTRTGYTFDKWDYNFNTPITSNKTITASWMANKNTPYKVEYYLENLEDDNYSLTQTISKTGTTDTTANAEIITFAHFTYKQSSTDSGNIAPNGSTVLKVYYTRDEYVVSQLDVNVGSVTNVGKYKYGTQITLTATEKPIGYSSFGWFNGDVLLSNKLIYNVTIVKDITAKYIVKEEMSNFNFISTLTECVITGIKDKTVTEIIVPNYVTSIDLGAFSGCFALEKIILPFVGAGEKGIEDEQYLFGYIFGNKSYDGGEEVWQHYAYNTRISYFIPISLQSVTILGNNIPKGSFSNCGMIKEVIISDTVKNINDYAFLQCDNLTSVKIPNSVINIGIRAFEGCSKLSSVIIGNSVTTIGNYAFSYCPKLTSVIIGNNVTAIGNYAFAGSKLLKHIDIPSSVTSMGGSSFTGCSSLESISIPFVGAKKDITINDYQYPLGYIFGQTEYDGSVVTEQTFRYSSGYTERTFYIPSSLKSVTITNDNVRYGAFSGCSNLTNISLLDSVCNIEGMAFYDCSSLTSITIPKDVTNIGYRAFDGCYKLVEVINKSPYINVEKGSDDNGCIGYYALSIFNSKDEYVNKFTTDSNGLVIYSDGINKILLGDVGKQVNITIPNDITEIHKYAFYNNRSLISLTIGKSVTNIGEYAFYNCHKLVEVINKSSYFTIEKSDYNNGYAGYYALSVSNCDDNYKSIIEINKNGFVICEYRFTNSHTLLLGYIGEETEIRLPGYIQIYKYALYDNDNITSVVIDRYTFGIGSCAFYDCDNLEAIGFTGYAVEWRNMSKATDWDYGFDGIKP